MKDVWVGLHGLFLFGKGGGGGGGVGKLEWLDR